MNSENLSPLQQAVQSFQTGKDRPAAKILVEALLQAEKTAKQERLRYPFSALTGEWRLYFTTGVRKVQRGGIKLSRGFYLPRGVPAQISFYPAEAEALPNYATPDVEVESNTGTIGNQIELGGLRLQFTGPCRYLGKKNLLAFDFTQLQISLFDRPFYSKPIRSGKQAQKTSQQTPFEQQPIAQLPFFTFFWITEDGIAARGRGGGLALWIRET